MTENRMVRGFRIAKIPIRVEYVAHVVDVQLELHVVLKQARHIAECSDQLDHTYSERPDDGQMKHPTESGLPAADNRS